MAETVAQSYSAEKVFLKIATAHSLQIYQKEIPAQMFSFEFCKNFKNAHFI